MQLMQETMNDRGEEQRGGGEEGNAAEDGVARGKKLSRVGRHRRDRSHTSQNHTRIEQGIEPGQFRDVVVAGHTKEE